MSAAVIAARWIGFVGAIVCLGMLGSVPSSDAVIVGVAIMLLGDAVVVRT